MKTTLPLLYEKTNIRSKKPYTKHFTGFSKIKDLTRLVNGKELSENNVLVVIRAD